LSHRCCWEKSKESQGEENPWNLKSGTNEQNCCGGGEIVRSRETGKKNWRTCWWLAVYWLFIL